MFLSVLFVIFTFGTLRLPQRDAFIGTGLVIIAMALVLFDIRSRLEIPHANTFEIFLVGFIYCTTLLRCTGVGLVGGAMRVKLHRQNKQLNEFAEKIEYMANYDDLTGILNRRAICQLVDKEMNGDRSPAPEKIFVSLLDLDHFKRINDQFGHGTGDDVLKLVTEILQGMLRKNDRVGRYGGEEFLLLFSAESVEEAKTILDRVRAAVADHAWDRILPNFNVTVSAGVAAHRPGEPMRALIHRADIALYEAKHRGRNCVVIGEDAPLAA
jgi:diguanylate cyclase (GGDEF)-like protein